MHHDRLADAVPAAAMSRIIEPNKPSIACRVLISLLRKEAVTQAAHRLDQAGPAAYFQLLPNARDMDLE